MGCIDTPSTEDTLSIIIHHGYWLKPGIEPFAFIARVREVMDPARDLADAKLLAELYAEAIDETWFKGGAHQGACRCRGVARVVRRASQDGQDGTPP
jgi:hypothetical protein